MGGAQPRGGSAPPGARAARALSLSWHRIMSEHDSNNSFRSESGGFPAHRLVDDLKRGDSCAATELHELFAPRLLRFVQRRMNPRLIRRLDADDVVQSAFRSFFRVVGDRDWESDGRAERVCSLLYAITLNKLHASCRFHAAEKRSIASEVYQTERLSRHDEQQAAILLAEEFEHVMIQNTPRHREIFELLMCGHSEETVADMKQCSVRTVYRVFERLTVQLQSRLSG